MHFFDDFFRSFIDSGFVKNMWWTRKKGYQLSDVDVIVANHINELPTSYVHVNRWFKHVTNQEDKPSEIVKLPKNVKSDLLAHFG